MRRANTLNHSMPLMISATRLMPLIFAISVMILTGFSCPSAAMAGQRVFVIPAHGSVEPGMAAFIERALERANEDPEALVVLEMDTFGGRVDSALEIVDAIVNIPRGQTIAYVSKKAISAGALIALACNRLAMNHHTTIGDCAPITYSNEGPKMMGEKFQSPLRAKFRSLARRNGYPEALAESMVTAEMIVYRVVMDGETRYMDAVTWEDLPEETKKAVVRKETVVAEGELLTMDDAEAEELGFSEMSAGDIPEMLARMGIENPRIQRVEEVWSETFVRFISTVAPVLMLIGLAALYMELQAPGVGLPGAVGVICLGLVFFNQYLVGLADHTEMILLALGVLMMGYEIFVLPGFGVAGFSGIALIALSMVLAMQNFVLPDPRMPWQMDLLITNLAIVLSAFVAAFISSMLVMRYVFPSMSRYVRQGPYLVKNLGACRADSTESVLARPGDEGVAVTLLRPSGKVRIGGETVDAISEATFLEKGATVRVMAIRGNHVIVERAMPERGSVEKADG